VIILDQRKLGAVIITRIATMDAETCRRARLARDPRFDGRFFVAVKTTGIYCRPICPAPAPMEKNVCYFDSAVAAAAQGYRPCLRCRPDSAPASFAWKGTDTTLERALKLIDNGALMEGSVERLSERLGIGPRYLNKLFQAKLGTGPKQYALYQQLLFAKSLLQQTPMPVTEIALAAGFGSVRRFNDCFARSLRLTPSALRRQSGDNATGLTLLLSYRPPYAWPQLRDFLQARLIPGLEWCSEESYGRTFRWPQPDDTYLEGSFTARHRPERCGFDVTLELTRPGPLLPVIRNIRRILDLDADIAQIDEQLKQLPGLAERIIPGLRLPGIWDPFEAGIRAVLGQQVSVAAARNLVSQVVDQVGPSLGEHRLFPTPNELAKANLSFLKIPGRRRDTVTRLAEHCATARADSDPDEWEMLPGIGPWTVRYTRMRGLSDSDIWLGTDLGVKRALEREGLALEPTHASPWQSYLTFQLWNLT